jgi:hypothetical protein
MSMNPAEQDRQIRMVMMVNKYATPLAILLVGLGLVFTQPVGAVKAVSAGLLVFGVLFNLLAVPAIRRLGSEMPWLPRLRMLVNIGVNIILVYFLGGYWTPIWMLLALTPIATAIYDSRRNTLLSAVAVSAALIGVQALRGTGSPAEWGELIGQVAFILLVSLLINELKTVR